MMPFPRQPPKKKAALAVCKHALIQTLWDLSKPIDVLQI